MPALSPSVRPDSSQEVVDKAQVRAFRCTDVEIIESGSHKHGTNMLSRYRIEVAIYLKLPSGLRRIPLINLHSNVLVTSNRLIGG